ncbi:MAG: Asp-tRNA(Asn)/Glu-tRNA(Gln) amidotransferase subunit GatC [Rhabdochlamydiaceae bacterium]|nr:Asp-tRNA(Asn)/Glu-tRNA(Gln) amidotransferase subunit GatC [Rhabdochlamydiaceae bacterium]
MSEFDENELDHLMKLCRIECSSEEKASLKENLAKVLKYIELLQEVDTEGVKPCLSVQESLVNVTREDVVENTLSREQFLANAPAHVGGMIRVPPVIKFANP